MTKFARATKPQMTNKVNLIIYNPKDIMSAISSNDFISPSKGHSYLNEDFFFFMLRSISLFDSIGCFCCKYQARS